MKLKNETVKEITPSKAVHPTSMDEQARIIRSSETHTKKMKVGSAHINSKMIIITAFVCAIIFGINAGRGPNGTFYGLPIVIYTLTLVISTRTRLTS